MSRPSNIVVSSIKRNQRFRGPTSSEQQNDFQSEVIRDFTVFQQEWNNKIVPLTARLPDGTADSLVNAFTNGLDGQTLFVVHDATALLAEGRFYNTTRDRPNTVFEEFINVFNYIDAQILALEESIAVGTSSGGLTADQKTDIGDHIFDDSLASNSTSLDGKSTIHTGNILQIAKDVYGTASPTLNTNGNAILANSVRAMVDALLELHGGNWDDNVSISHANVDASDITTGTMLQARIGPSSGDPGGVDDTFAGSPSDLRGDLNQLRRLVKEIKGTASFTTVVAPDGTWTGVVPQPSHFTNLITLKGTAARSTANPWGYSYLDIPDLVTVLGNIRDFTGQSAIGDSTPDYTNLNGFLQGAPLTTAISALAINLTGTQAGLATVSGSLDTHIANVSNPHLTTLTQAAAAGGTAPANVITITDIGGYYTSAHVEGALQEVGAELVQLSVDIANESASLSGLISAEIDTVENTIASATFRRFTFTVTGLVDDGTVAITHSAGMFPQVQVINFDAVSGIDHPANSVMPVYNTTHAGILIVHDSVDQLTLHNKLDVTLASGLVIVQW